MTDSEILAAIRALKVASWEEGKAYAARYPETVGHPDAPRLGEAEFLARMRAAYDREDDLIGWLNLQAAVEAEANCAEAAVA